MGHCSKSSIVTFPVTAGLGPVPVQSFPSAAAGHDEGLVRRVQGRRWADAVHAEQPDGRARRHGHHRHLHRLPDGAGRLPAHLPRSAQPGQLADRLSLLIQRDG